MRFDDRMRVLSFEGVDGAVFLRGVVGRGVGRSVAVVAFSRAAEIDTLRTAMGILDGKGVVFFKGDNSGGAVDGNSCRPSPGGVGGGVSITSASESATGWA